MFIVSVDDVCDKCKLSSQCLLALQSVKLGHLGDDDGYLDGDSDSDYCDCDNDGICLNTYIIVALMIMTMILMTMMTKPWQ